MESGEADQELCSEDGQQWDAQDHLQGEPGPEGGACSRHDECQKSNIMYEIHFSPIGFNSHYL